jgi:S-adenosylhomocysteine hydrolase
VGLRVGNAYAVYRALTQQADAPQLTRLLDQLRTAAARTGGALRQETLEHISDPLASKIAGLALRNRAAFQHAPRPEANPRGWERDPDGWHRSDGIGFTNGDPRDSWLALITDYARGLTGPETSPAAEVKLEELTPQWVAAYFTFLVMVEGHRNAPLSSMLRSMTPDIVRFQEVQGEVNRSRDAGGASTFQQSRLQQARERLVLAPQALATAPAVLAKGAQALGPAARELLALEAPGGDQVLDEAGAQEQLLGLLEREHLEGIRISAAEAMRAAAGPMPALHAVAAELSRQGLLRPDTFRDVELFVRTHGLPSTTELVKVLVEQGGLRAVSGHFKGVSTAPLAVAAADRVMKAADPGHHDARFGGSDERPLVEELSRTFASARNAGRVAMVLGDGRETVAAVAAAAAENPGTTVGYVEFTQSGVNALRERGPLPFDVTALAETALKKLAESDLLGSWLVDRLREESQQGHLPDLRTAPVAVIGQGDVGGGVARALVRSGSQSVLGLDRSAATVDLALGHGLNAAHWQTGEPLPQAQLYIAATGGAGTVDEAALRAMPDGAHVVNYASRGELDEGFLERVAAGQVPGARLDVETPNPLPEHETLRLELTGPAGEVRRVHLHKRAQPYFDGRKDKDPMLVDLYMSGLLASLAVQAKRLRDGSLSGPQLRGLDPSLQRTILKQVAKLYPEARYAELLSKVRAALGER